MSAVAARKGGAVAPAAQASHAAAVLTSHPSAATAVAAACVAIPPTLRLPLTPPLRPAVLRRAGERYIQHRTQPHSIYPHTDEDTDGRRLSSLRTCAVHPAAADTGPAQHHDDVSNNIRNLQSCYITQHSLLHVDHVQRLSAPKSGSGFAGCNAPSASSAASFPIRNMNDGSAG